MHKVLPDDLYEKLRKWDTAFQQKSNHKEYYKKIHIQISQNNIDLLESNEIDILNNLLSDKNQIINKDNLWDYFWEFDNIKSENIYKKLKEIKIKKFKKEKQLKTNQLLNNFSFKDADELYKKETIFEKKEYEKLKAKYIKKYFEEKFVKKGIIKNAPDLEQAEAIGAVGKNVLVSARAGSGKTQTISGKVAFLVKKYDINPKEILVLCFNKSAAENMKNRIKKLVPEFENAKTFHSWAWSIVDPRNGSVLFDVNGNFAPKQFSDFVKTIIENLESNDEEFKENIYNFFREEYQKLDENLSENRLFKNEEDKYLYLRNQTEITLSGINVKSRGEKWIADFLFEHGIEFYYEQQFFWQKLNEKYFYHPDFTIKYNNKTFILEHWGIDENDLEKEVPNFWTKTWEQYKEEMKNKRNLFAKNEEYKNKFIETSINDINYSLSIKEQRREFEYVLKQRLEDKKIVCNKLTKEELIKRAWKNQLFSRLNTLMTQFIGWMQKLEWEEKDLKTELEKKIYNKKQKKFCEIGLLVYKEYVEELGEKIDFNILISKAIQKIKTERFDVSTFKYILIDEFQDFSQLFQNLINAIREKNLEVNLFCVGDSWQLINGFAGSDEKFFKEFEEKSTLKIISTCYRSEPQIIDNGNDFANKYSIFSGQKSEYFKKGGGEIENFDINNVFIENNAKNQEDNEFKKYFHIKQKDSQKEFLTISGILKARYLKKCFEIIKENRGKSFLFLSRNKKLKGIDLYDFFIKKDSYLKKLLKEKNIRVLDENIDAQTMHSSKGLEADIVILLDICEKTIPSIHPSNELFEIFGRTPTKILDEEKRLFYVAITRAKKKLFILMEEGNESEFLS